jgi:hypothetical protein
MEDEDYESERMVVLRDTVRFLCDFSPSKSACFSVAIFVKNPDTLSWNLCAGTGQGDRMLHRQVNNTHEGFSDIRITALCACLVPTHAPHMPSTYTCIHTSLVMKNTEKNIVHLDSVCMLQLAF